MTVSKTQIKICGITSVNQALEIARLGVDAIGIISVEESPRYVLPSKKKEIFENLSKYFPKVKRVSVIKNVPTKKILEALQFNKNENVVNKLIKLFAAYCEGKFRQYIAIASLAPRFKIICTIGVKIKLTTLLIFGLKSS